MTMSLSERAARPGRGSAEMDLAQMGAVLVRYRISLDAATRIMQTDRGEVEIPIWIARRLGETVSREVAIDAVRELARRQGLRLSPAPAQGS